jgi:hypothetical protein
MKKALLTLLLGAVLTSAAAMPALAEDVYVTKSGKKYHNAESKWIKNKEAEKIAIEEAIARGLEPSKEYLRWKETQIEGQDE